MSLFFLVGYNVLRVPLYFVAKLAGLFNAKIGQTFADRSHVWSHLTHQLEHIPPKAKRLWIHASSMGEYEQAVPLVQELLRQYPEAWMVVSIFSPSGYRHIKEAHERTIVTYLPFDSMRNVRRFLDLVQPAVQIIIRHDIWPNYQWALAKRGIPSILADASISDKSLKSAHRFRLLYQQVYNTFSAICAVSEQQAERLKSLFPHHDTIRIGGDTRFDRVRDRALDKSKIEPLLASGLFRKERCLVVGSSWPEDERVIFPAIARAFKQFKDFSLIIAPHELTPAHLESIENFAASAGVECVRWSAFEKATADCRMLLVDTIGLLANLYALGILAYVGGAYGMGVHSVLEPAAHGMWISYGPGYTNSHEATDMAGKISVVIKSSADFEKFLLPALDDIENTKDHAKRTLEYMQNHFGASQKTASVVAEFLR